MKTMYRAPLRVCGLFLALLTTGRMAHAESCPEDLRYASASLERISADRFSLRLPRALPNVYLIQTSSNLVNWGPPLTNVVLGASPDPLTLVFGGSMGFVRIIQQEPPHVAGRLLVRFRQGTTPDQQKAALSSVAATSEGLIQTPAMNGSDTPAIVIARTALLVPLAARMLSTNPVVQLAEADWIVTAQVLPNDPLLSPSQPAGRYWNLGCSQCSAAPLTSSYGSQAAAAWAAGFTGSTEVLAGVVDEGIEFAHGDLAANMWINPGESGPNATNLADDDGNGYIDDEHGWNYFQSGLNACSVSANGNGTIYSGSPGSLVDTHGTHVAGIIGARGNNRQGQAGVCWAVTMVPSKFLGPNGGSASCAAMAIDYLTELRRRGSNIVVINASWGGSQYSTLLHEAIIRAAKRGILVVAAAGNCGQNIDVLQFYPACYDTRQRAQNGSELPASFDAVISVAAIDRSGVRAGFSNYGATNVDLYAPGVDIFSTEGGGYSSREGTSMAAAHVTGALALFAAAYPNTTAEERKTALLGTLAGGGSVPARLHVARFVSSQSGCAGPDCTLYVNSAYTGTVQNGCLATPFRSVLSAYAAAGDPCTLRVAPGTYGMGNTPLPNKSILFEPNGGPVLLTP